MARQRLRLTTVRKPGQFDDQKTPAQIAQAETTSTDEQQFVEHLLSQIRQILGTDDWHDPVPADLSDLDLSRNWVWADCAAGDLQGNTVYVTADVISGRYQVTTADYTDWDKLPGVGVIIEKSGPTECKVQLRGLVEGLFNGLLPGRPYFLGADGRPSLTVTSAPATYIQRLGVALGSQVLFLEPNYHLTKRA